jgi:pantoate--beta-alanine ligase
MMRDLLISHPLPKNLYIMPTARDPAHGTAVSSRNAHLTPEEERQVAPTLYHALSAAKIVWETSFPKVECLAKAHAVIETRMHEARLEVDMRMDFIEINDADSFDVIEDYVSQGDLGVALLNGALFVGKTSLIDNLILMVLVLFTIPDDTQLQPT